MAATKPRIVKRLPEETADRTLKVIGGRWKTCILWAVCERPMRLSEIERVVPQASQKVIIQQLREMAEHGLVSREVFAEVPPRVQYRATALGRSLRPVVRMLCEWGRRHARERPSPRAAGPAAQSKMSKMLARRFLRR